MNQIKRIFGALACAMLLSLHTAAPTHAEDFGGLGLSIGALLMELELSAEQKTAVADILKKHRAQIEHSLEQLRSKREALQGLIGDVESSDEQLREAARELSASIEEVAVLRKAIRSGIQQVLDQRQRDLIANASAQGKDRFEERTGIFRKLVFAWVERHASS